MFIFSLIILAVVMSINVLLGFVVWSRATKKPLNRIFGLLTLSIVAWSVVGFFDQTTTSQRLLNMMASVPFVAGLFIFYFIAAFSLYFPETQINALKVRKAVWWLMSLTALPVIGLIVYDHGLIIAKTTTSVTDGNNIVPGPLYGVFPLFLLIWLAVALTNLVRKFRHAKHRVERMQLTYIFMGFSLMTCIAILTNIVIPTVLKSPAISRFGFLSTLFLIGCFSYTIVAHRLFNIRLLVARSVAYLLLLVTLGGLYGAAIFAIGSLFFPDEHFSRAEALVFITLAVILAFTYQPLRRFFERVTDSIFFRDRYDTQTVLNNVGGILASELILGNMLDRSIKEICRSLRIGSGSFVVFEGTNVYRRAFYGSQPKDLMDHVLLHQLTGMPVADELAPGRTKEILVDHDVRVALELRTKNEVVGHLLLGDKLSGDIYSDQDVALLEILRKQLAVAIANARAYEQIARFNVTLQEQVAKATQRLRTANKNLKVLDKAKDDFISMASHQLGTPLTAITGYLSMTIDNDKNNMTLEQQQFVTFALEAAERMGAMSSDLLNVSRLSAGRFVIRREPTDLVKMVQQEIDQLRPSAERKGLSLTLKAETLPLVGLDVSKTRQVIMNFIDNAIYYTEQGGIAVNLHREHDAVALTVQDTGMGVPPAEKAKLFSKFYRAENAKTVRPDGTGLGLYLAKQVVEEQGGSLIFESEEGRGSTFGFMLPIAGNEPAEASEQPQVVKP